MDLYDRIEILLHENNMTKKSLCERTGISYNTLSSLFKRRSKRVEVEALQKIAICLNTTIEYLTSGSLAVGKLSEEEVNLVIAYRNSPAMRDAVKRLLGIE